MTSSPHERRIHRVFVTQNTEYHLRRDLCVGVRDRRTGSWSQSHGALQTRVAASITVLANGSLTADPRLPTPGQRIIFEGESSVMTGPVIAVERPDKGVVMDYPATFVGY